MAGTPIKYHQSSQLVGQSQVFRGIHFVLLGFDPINKLQVSRKLVNGGGVDAGQYGPDCTHFIVDKIVYDDPLCVAARQDDKILVSSLWVDHSFDAGAPVDTTSVMYIPVRDLNGIPGAKSLVICLTGYLREDREDIMTMVQLMGAQVSKPLIANKVTHLICYKFEGEKYLLAKKVKRIKIINHRWLEDCLKAWEILPETDYSKSGYELEMEAEARDSEDESERDTTRHNDRSTTSPHHSLLSKQEIPKTVSTTIDSNLFSNAQETVSISMKTTSDQSPKSHETKIMQQVTENVTFVTSKPSNHYDKVVTSSPAQDNIFISSTSAKKSPQSEPKTVISASYDMKDPVRITPPKLDMKSNTSISKSLNKLNLNDAFNMSSSLVHKMTPYNDPVICVEDEQNDVSSDKGKMGISYGSFKQKQLRQNDDVETTFQEMNKDPTVEMSPAQNSPLNFSGRKSLTAKGKNVICEVPISKTSNLEIEELYAMQKPQKECKETSLSTISDNKDAGIVENVMQSPSVVSSDIKKSGNLNSEINEQSGGSNSKPVRKKSISKKFSAPKLAKKNTVNQKGSIFSKNTEPEIDDENLFKYQQSEKDSSVAKSCAEKEKGVINGIQIENMFENKSLCMDDETEPPDDKDEAIIDNINDENDLLSVERKVLVHKSDGSGKKGKKKTDFSMKEVTDKNSVKKNELMIGDNYGKQEITEEMTPNQAKRARETVNDLEKSMEVKRGGVCNDLELDVNEKVDDVDADVDMENVVSKNENKRNKHSLSKTKKVVSKRNATDLEKSVVAEKLESVFNEEKNNYRDDKDADVDTENVLDKKKTYRNKKDDVKTVNKKRKLTSNLAVKPSDFEIAQSENVEIRVGDPEKKNEETDNDQADKDADVDTMNVMKKKETNRNKRPLSKTKKDDTKIVNKKGKSTSNKAVKTRDLEEAQKENVQADKDADVDTENEENDNNEADKDADVDTENVLKKKETNTNKRQPSKTKIDDTKTVNKKKKPTFNKVVKTRDLEEAGKENVQIHVNDESKEISKKDVTIVNSGVLKDEPMCFILTGHNLQKKEFEQIIRRLKGKVCKVKHNWSYQATHFIVPDPIRRTEKFFSAAASGRWILKTDYLTASNHAGKFLPEETYEWYKNGLSEDGQVNLEAPRKWRLIKEKNGYGAFYGLKIVIYGECISPPLDTLKRAVKAGDGIILATSPPYTRFLTTGIDFAVVSPGMPHVDVWVQEFLKHEIPCVSADYLVEYVCKPGFSLEKHVQFGTNVWAERSYNSLKNRLEEEICKSRSPDSDDVACEVCGARDRGEEMLICGDESGLIGCGVGTHIGCCEPPLDGVPEVDWFCDKCSKKPNKSKKPNNKKGSKKKGSACRGK